MRFHLLSTTDSIGCLFILLFSIFVIVMKFQVIYVLVAQSFRLMNHVYYYKNFIDLV